MGLRQFEPIRARRDLDRKATQLLTGARQPHWVPVDVRQVLAGELPRGAFGRRFVLGGGPDLGAVEARYADGVLHLTIPPARASRPRRIKVDTAAAASDGSTGGEPPLEPTGELGRVEGQTYDPSI